MITLQDLNHHFPEDEEMLPTIALKLGIDITKSQEKETPENEIPGLSEEDREYMALVKKMKRLGGDLNGYVAFLEAKKASEKEASPILQQSGTRVATEKREAGSYLGDAQSLPELYEPDDQESAIVVMESNSLAAFEEKHAQQLKQFQSAFEAQKIQMESMAELIAGLKALPPYSYAWFSKFIEIEMQESDQNRSNRKSPLKLSFRQIRFVTGINTVIELLDGNRPIPTQIEDLGNLTLKIITNEGSYSLSVEVVSVKDRTIKAKVAQVYLLKDIPFDRFNRAELEIQDPIFLLEKLKEEFSLFSFPEDFDMKQNLPKSIKFIFGPPGTGKTTHLTRELLLKDIKTTRSKTLALTPTKKAADVLIHKVMEHGKAEDYVGKVYRFGSTGDPRVEQSGLVIDKNSDLGIPKSLALITTIARLPYDYLNPLGYLKDIPWDVVIFDEASMIGLPWIIYSVYQLAKVNPKTVFYVAGDPFQIQPVNTSPHLEAGNIYEMVKLDKFFKPQTEPHPFEVLRLITQYRSVPSIGKLFSQFCYSGLLHHHRNESDRFTLPPNELLTHPISFVDFPVRQDHSLYAAQHLNDRSPFHGYSALLAVEIAAFISKLAKSSPTVVRMGIVSPYHAQGHLIERIANKLEITHSKFSLNCGTIHSFQGDECEIILAVFNPPSYISDNENMFLNKSHILNVAISRARDYLIILEPDGNTRNALNLSKIRSLRGIANRFSPENIRSFLSNEVESIILGDPNFIEQHTFSTSHQNINVYGKTDYRYEIRCETTAIDIQIGEATSHKSGFK